MTSPLRSCATPRCPTAWRRWSLSTATSGFLLATDRSAPAYDVIQSYGWPRPAQNVDVEDIDLANRALLRAVRAADRPNRAHILDALRALSALPRQSYTAVEHALPTRAPGWQWQRRRGSDRSCGGSGSRSGRAAEDVFQVGGVQQHGVVADG